MKFRYILALIAVVISIIAASSGAATLESSSAASDSTFNAPTGDSDSASFGPV